MTCRFWLQRGVVVLSLLALSIAANWIGAEAQAVDELTTLHRQVRQLQDQGSYADATPIAEHYVALARKKRGEEGIEFAMAINLLASLYKAQGRYAEAEPLMKRSLAIREKVGGPYQTDVAVALNNLAGLYSDQGRFAEAEPLYLRSISLYERLLGSDDPFVVTVLTNLAFLYGEEGRYADAEVLLKRGLAISERRRGVDVGAILDTLAEIYRFQNRYAEAEPLYKSSLAIREQALGPNHPYVGIVLSNLASLYSAQGRYGEAEALYMRSLPMAERLGPDHRELSTVLNNLAGLYLMQRNWTAAVEYGRRSTNLVIRRSERGTDDVGQAVTGKSRGEAEQHNEFFWRLVKAAHRLAEQDGPLEATLAREMFRTAQWAQGSAAGSSLAQMAARGAKADAALASLVRERQNGRTRSSRSTHRSAPGGRHPPGAAMQHGGRSRSPLSLSRRGQRQSRGSCRYPFAGAVGPQATSGAGARGVSRSTGSGCWVRDGL